MASPLHPGRIVQRDYLQPQGLSVAGAARLLGVSRQTLTKIVNGKGGISPEMAIRLAKQFGGKPETWQKLQRDYDLAQARSHTAGSQPVWVKSEDLVNWADRIEARYSLPHLIRRLVAYEANAIRRLDFPAYEDAQSPGWDGLVDSSDESRYVPSGLSVWELSTEKDPGAKASRDYEKRKGQSSDFNPREATYVAVTARRWKQKDKWAADKSREGFWKQVVAYDATSLEQWLEFVPPVAIWFATRIGLPTGGLQSLESFWGEFRRGTSPPITPELVLAGRDDGIKRLQQWLQQGPSVLRILADSPDEAVAFVAAAVSTVDSDHIFARSVLVTDAEAARQLIAGSESLTLVWMIDDPSLIPSAVEEQHSVIVPLGRGATMNDAPDIELSRLGRNAFVTALKDVLPGEDQTAKEKEAERIARKTSRSLTVYRRLYPSSGVVKRPAWAEPQPDQAGSLIAALLAGSWNERTEADKTVLERLAGGDYTSVARVLTQWRNQPDSPVRRLGDVWSLVAPLDSWSRLTRLLTGEDIDRFTSVLIAVLGASDPSLDLPPDKRWLANVHGKQFQHSHALREGLTNSLILLGVVGDEAVQQIGRRGADVACRVVATLLEKDTQPGRWASLGSLLPRIAEAAPNAFLDALEADLQRENPFVLELFEDEGGISGAGGRYPSLLWALEMLAWDPEYLSRAAQLLAQLARRAPEVQLGNKPEASLREIFCTWHPNTAASLYERMQVLDRLLKKESDVSWQLILQLLPKGHDVAQNTAEPRWRAKPERGPVTIGEVRQAIDEVVRRALSTAEQDPNRLAELVGRMATWSREQRAELREQVESVISTAGPKEKTLLWHTVRDFLADHRSFPDADWSLPESELIPWKSTCGRLEPTDVLERCIWLFNDHLPRLPQELGSSSSDSFSQREREVAEIRRQAISGVIQDRGVVGVFAMAQRVEHPWLLGRTLAEIVGEKETEKEVLETALGSGEKAFRVLGCAFVGVCEGKGSHWPEKILRSPMFRRWSTQQKADFFSGLSPTVKTWTAVSRCGPAVEEQYWKQTSVWVRSEDSNQTAEIAVQRLLRADRVFEAVQQASYHHEKLTSESLLEVLSQGLKRVYTGESQLVGGSYHFEMIFSGLRKRSGIPREELAKLEWLYLPLLRPSQVPQTLHQYLGESPDFFAEILSYVYKPEGEAAEEEVDVNAPEQQIRNRATLGWELLNSWRGVPGYKQDGTLDPEYLADWFKKARAACLAKERSTIGDIRIGSMLAHAPADEDGMWPHRAVRDLIEDADSRKLESGIATALFNKRGVTTKSPFEGGRSERKLASDYRRMARFLRAQWPRTAGVLRDVADIYEAWGRDEDIRADMLDLTE